MRASLIAKSLVVFTFVIPVALKNIIFTTPSLFLKTFLIFAYLGEPQITPFTLNLIVSITGLTQLVVSLAFLPFFLNCI
ncbi:Uncharacterized protein TCM_040647 [Theobroma cacao]|uniref:Uncharacterized protein n=1 Tax=Theobroma cacao TaxID=3641 RepID=A0A061GU01_THECC|nr:Uncharacterized protein TCM_040647 [Theobroma cacao]